MFELYPAKAPATVDNFLKYVAAGFYSDTAIHRIVPSFVFQGGGYTSDLKAKAPLYAPIVLESNNGLSNVRGTLAMARTDQPNSATSQFFVNTADNLALNYDPSVVVANGYAVFGKIISGVAVMDRIGVSLSDASGVPIAGIRVYWVKQLK
ncbi:peptidylprolyl isomerase [Niveibacterium microcysteis]|uniref:Peptidyl-prolyl cis-trans isomerase n=1 Tax=Niveibacterium microcysteis TaxID=2811415 RepID=A0ABX7MAG4_9RHOO|nr:peptidylprolyl isomerase [Niveibacterium microcysteis]